MSKIKILVAILLLVLTVCPALADDPEPDEIQVMLTDQVLVAHGADTAGISVTVLNQSNPVEGLDVSFILDDSSLGSLSPGSAVTSASGIAETTFSAGTKAGIAGVSVRVFYDQGGIQYSEVFAVGEIEILNPIPDTITLTTTKEWLVANGQDSCYAILEVRNGSYPIPNLDIDFSILEQGMGSFSPEGTLTNSSGIATSRFTVAKKSGNATLKAFVTYHFRDNVTVIEQQCIQKIDHDTPYILSSYNAPGEMSVGATAPIIMRYIDRWGNPVDNRRIAETVQFLVSSPLGDALFLNATSPFTVMTVPVDALGEATAWLQASTSPAINVVRVNPDMGSIPDKYFFVQGLANRPPVAIHQAFNPEGYLNNPPKLYADGVSLYAITYTLTDEFGNGVMNTPVQITTTVQGEDRIVYTNSLGQAMITYGPKSSIGKITLTARSVDNSSVSCSKEVWFISQEAEDMQFTAVPDSMPSRDVVGWIPAELMAKVIDENGNPVEGELVTFSLGTPVYEETYTITDNPELVSTTAVTNSDGFAIVLFNPGGFTADWLDLHYDETASGTIQATAFWQNATLGKSATQTLILSWKNYPYLSIETEVYPQTVNVTGFVDVLVRLKGDGWALRPKPIDVVLCTDRSGSMLQDDPDDRIVPVMIASKEFTGVMKVSPSQDHVGLVSFGTNGRAKLSPEYRYLSGYYYCYRSGSGWSNRYLNGWFYDWTNMYGVSSNSNYVGDTGFKWVYRDSYWDMPTTPTTYNYQSYWPYTIAYDTGSSHQTYVNSHYPGDNRFYGEYAVIESHLAANPALINSSVDMMVPSGGTPMRYGIYRAINEIRDNGRASAVRAIIVLSDGDYNWYGDPLARGSSYKPSSPENNPYVSVTPPTLPTRSYWPFDGLTVSEQNMSAYAKNNNIRIYSIGYAEDISTDGRNTLRILAESTGGKYYNGDAANIADIYRSIAGDLQTMAGVGTEVDLKYDTLEVDNLTVTVNDTYRVFDYVPETHVDSTLANGTRPAHEPSYPYTVDQTAEFNGTRNLGFDIGTIYLGQVWEAMYRLQVLDDGTINIFGPGSSVAFNGTVGQSSLSIPKTYITGVPEMVTTGFNTSSLNISVGESTQTESGMISWPIYRNYTGVMLVTEDYYISNDGGMTWILIDKRVLTPEQANQNGVWSYPRRLLPPGDLLFRVVSNAGDAPGPVISAAPPAPQQPSAGRNYIILK
jgi:hypothetical protein